MSSASRIKAHASLDARLHNSLSNLRTHAKTSGWLTLVMPARKKTQLHVHPMIVHVSPESQSYMYGTHIQDQDPKKGATQHSQLVTHYVSHLRPRWDDCQMRRTLTVYVPCLPLSVPAAWSLCTFTKGRGLTLTFARILVRAPVDKPGLQPADARDHTECAVRALVPTMAV